MTFKNLIWFTGLWSYPPFVGILYLLFKYWNESFMEKPSDIICYLIIFGIPLLFVFYLWSLNRKKHKNGETEFTFQTTFGTEAQKGKSKAWRQATYPNVSGNYLSSKPQGLVLGRNQGKYVYLPVGKDGVNFFAIGSPGSGKSVLLLGFLYANLYVDRIIKKAKARTSDRFNFFLVDIKGELYESLLKIKGGKYRAVDDYPIQVVQPSNRESYGWDVFYRMRMPGATTTDKLKAVTDIADGLIEETGDNPYFSDNAKKILTGVLFFYEGKGLEFIQIIQKLTRSNLGELLKEIVEEAELDGNGIVLDSLKSFVGKEDNESIQDVDATLKKNLSVFSYPDIIYCFKDNPHRTSPAALNDGVSNIDLAIEESMLLTYKTVFRLLCIQMLRHAEADFKAKDARRTAIIIDEAARVGKVEGLDGAMATLRSRHCSLILFFQDMAQFRDIYKKEKADSILNICELKAFLSGAGDKSTTDFIANMAGKYTEIKTSYGKTTFGKKDVKYSEEEKNIVDGKSLMELREKNEIICVIYGHYYRFKKLQYFRDPYLKGIAEEIKQFNSEQ